MRKFAPLRIISGYSFLQSGLTIDKIAKSIASFNYDGAAIADFGVLYGIPEFIKEMEKINKPYIVGLSVSSDDDLVIYANDEQGYKNLIQISKHSVNKSLDLVLLKKLLGHTTVVLETNHGKFKQLFEEGLTNEYVHYLADLSKYPDGFYLGLEITNKKEFRNASAIREFAKNHSYDLIAFPRIRYQKSEDAIILKLVDAIDKNEQIEIKEEKGQFFFQSVESYQKLYLAEELDNTIKVIGNSHFVFNQKRGELMHFPCENSRISLKNAVFAGLNQKNINDEQHIERANYELSVINSMGYADYFLIVNDFVKYAKSHDIVVGPGRGSAAGSLVSYALNITEIDPLKYDLQFERFLNKARKSLPDIDVDFMDTRRKDMVQYMREKYGENRVANITTFQTIKAKQALRDIGRIYNIPNRDIDMLAKSITDKLSLREAYKKVETFRNLVDSDKYFLDIVTLASKIEDLPRQPGLHPAGIILNEKPIDEVLPITLDIDDSIITQYEKDYLEEQGFLKFDFLALRNLTTIDTCIKLINKNHGLNLDFYHIPYEDKEIFSLISSCKTAGIFQLESSGMRNAIKILEPKEFNDIVTLLAIFRPGPLDNIQEYANRKNGKIKITYLSPEMEKVLAPTYGVIVYQEQVSSIAMVMAGFSPTDADLFRSAVSHKDREKLLNAKKDFILGSVKNGYKQKDAEKIFSDILKFSNYGLNKSHAVVYALTASRMGYLKYFYPLEFYTSLLSTSSGANDSSFNECLQELRSRGLKIFPPDINESELTFKIKENGLVFPFSFIKGFSYVNSNKIIDERTINGPYKDFFDFVKRQYGNGISEATIIKLIDAGCFDNLYPSRASLRSTTKYALQFAELSYGNNGQMIIDDTLEDQKRYFNEPDVPLDNLSVENDALGVTLSDSPLTYMKDLLISNHALPIVEAKDSQNTINIAGIVSQIKTIKTRKTGSTMAFMKMFDQSGEIEVTVFPTLFTEKYKLLTKNNILLITGHYEKKDEKESFVAEKISLLQEAI